MSRTGTIFRFLLIEEWRLHTQLFGGVRFALFPAMIAGIVAAGAFALAETGYTTGEVLFGLHVLVLGFGLYSGTAGFAGSDMLENVFGRLSLLLSTGATLPLGRRYLLGVFLLKDGLFYGAVIVLPAAIGTVPLLGLDPATPIAVAGLWLSMGAVFAAGMALTVAAIAVRTRAVPAWLITVAVAGLVAVTWMVGLVETLRLFVVPYAMPILIPGLLAGTAVLVTASLVLYDPTYGRPDRTAADRFATLEGVLPGANRGLVAKTILDLGRSSGGFWKPFVSSGILLVLVAALVSVVTTITGVAPSPGIFFGGVLGLSAFTTYNWLTEFDSIADYLAYPVTVEDVFRAKQTAFVLVGTPTVVLPYLIAVAWFRATPLDVIAGAAVLGGFGLYYYGLTVYIAGFDPNEFLFDAVRFGTFTVGVAVVLVPTLVVGFVVVPPGPLEAGIVVAASVVCGLIGELLARRSGPRWNRRYKDNG